MTTITQMRLVAPQQVPTADTALYTVPAQTTAKIGRAVFTNTSGFPVTLTAGITTGGALSAATTLISARTLAPGESYVSPELAGAVMPAGAALRALAGTAAAITVMVSGLTIV